jgi:hypothetical protein
MENYGGNLWSGLALHVAILAASWLQLVTYWYLGATTHVEDPRATATAAAAPAAVLPEPTSELLVVPREEDDDAKALPPPTPSGFDHVAAATGRLLRGLTREGTVMATYVVVAAVALASTPSLMSAL